MLAFYDHTWLAVITRQQQFRIIVEGRQTEYLTKNHIRHQQSIFLSEEDKGRVGEASKYDSKTIALFFCFSEVHIPAKNLSFN